MSMLRFWKFSSKSRKIRVRKRSLNRLIVLVSFTNCDPFPDRSKSKVQTTGRQEPRPCLQILFAKINYFPNARTNEGRTSVFLHYRTDRALRAITSPYGPSRPILNFMVELFPKFSQFLFHGRVISKKSGQSGTPFWTPFLTISPCKTAKTPKLFRLRRANFFLMVTLF